ncbi:hypothetical protein LCGC14_1306710 [marine sediment metagenome]|uniref:DUF5615 domain-containing protein n=1 Tax=marine sediment metagenome TaxID=412755 RepID=A0A0F9KNH3_9ZZZZ
MIRYAMTRGLLVVDENVNTLANLLRGKNFRVLELLPGTQDDVIIEQLCAGRIIVTTNVVDFVDLAPIYEFGIIAVTADAMVDPARVANVISIQYSRRSLRASEPFLLKITVDGHTFKMLN